MVPKDKRLAAYAWQFIKSSGLGECTQLCDVGEIEHVCDLIPEEFALARAGQGARLSSLDTILSASLVRYLEHLKERQEEQDRARREKYAAMGIDSQRIGGGRPMELCPTLDFLQEIENVKEALADGPWDERTADEVSHRLRYAWFRWVAYLSSVHMWQNLPRHVAAKKVKDEQASQSRENAKKGGRKPTHDWPGIFAAYDQLWPEKGRDTAAIVAARFSGTGVTADAIRRKVKALDKKTG
jgi:hypothetical protein